MNDAKTAEKREAKEYSRSVTRRGFVLARTEAPAIPQDTLQLESKTAHLTWGTGVTDAIMERAWLDSGENNETGKNATLLGR